MMPPLYRVRGVGKIGFWSVANGLSGMHLGSKCNEEWQRRLAKMRKKWKIGELTYSSEPEIRRFDDELGQPTLEINATSHPPFSNSSFTSGETYVNAHW